METLQTVIEIIQLALLVYFGGTTVYLFTFALAGSLKCKSKQYRASRTRHITVIIPAFMEDPVIVEVIQSALKQDYPSGCMEIILVADSLKAETLSTLRSLPIKVVPVNFEQSTKAKSLKAAMEHVSHEAEVVLILDADNIMEDHFLSKINCTCESGYGVIQCHRIAKNTNTSFALLDAISEEVNNNIFRNGHRALGLSSALIGSAMVFNIELFRKYIPQLSAVGGFDKELELMLLSDGIKIEYDKEAYVLDEKVQNAQVFYKQRKRWISSQIFFFGKDFLPSLFHLITRGNVDYFNKTLQFSLPPRILLLGIVVLACFLSFFFRNLNSFNWWFGILLMLITTLLVSVPRRFYTLKTLQAVISLPRIFLLMIFILLRMRGSNKEFLHTEHNYNKK